MKLAKKWVALSILSLTLVSGSQVASAGSLYNGPAEALAGLTGKTVAEVVEERLETRQSYGQLAIAAGVFDAFQEERLQMRIDDIEEAVAAGRITRTQGDARIQNIEDRIALCDGTGTGMCGLGNGQGFGGGRGQGFGGGRGQGFGGGRGQGFGGGRGCNRW